MTAVAISPPPYNQPFLDGKFVSGPWQIWFAGVMNAVFQDGADKVDAAYVAAMAAAPGSTQVVALGGVGGGGPLSGNVAVRLYQGMTQVASLPTTGNTEGDFAYATDGRKVGEAAGSGTGVPVWWSNGAWHAIDSGAVVAA